ncbi:hypothetical protein AB0B01_27130 [Streptomyces sp. NPDC044571]|uniref:hypothetical protein n=1 Tax=Streptomyces sp. NPDC044571 TaxID=3155371 RepID=UPI0033CD1D8A
MFQLPTYAPDLSPQEEGVWSLVKRDIGDLAAANLGQITRAVNALRQQDRSAMSPLTTPPAQAQ